MYINDCIEQGAQEDLGHVPLEDKSWKVHSNQTKEQQQKQFQRTSAPKYILFSVTQSRTCCHRQSLSCGQNNDVGSGVAKTQSRTCCHSSWLAVWTERNIVHKPTDNSAKHLSQSGDVVPDAPISMGSLRL